MLEGTKQMTPVFFHGRWHVQDPEGNLSAFSHLARARVETHIDTLKRGLVKWENIKLLNGPDKGFRSKLSNHWIVNK